MKFKMKKCRTLLSVCTAFAFVVLMLSACSSEEDANKIEPASGGTKAVSIKAIQDVLTRAIGESDQVVNDALKLTIDRGGHIFFVESSSGLITHYVELTVGGYESGKNVPRIAFDKIKDTSGTIGNVPEESDWVYIIVNLPDGRVFDSPQGGWIGAKYEDITDLFITAEDLYDGTGGVKSVPVSGNAAIDKTTNPDVPAVTVPLKAIASRFEIEKIALNTTVGVGDWESDYAVANQFTVQGIYINNYYPSVSLSGNYTDLVDAESDTLHYDVSHKDFYWTEANYGRYLYTVNAGTTADNTSLSATADKAWAYNLFPNDLPGNKTKFALPHIVLKITGLRVTSNNGLAVVTDAESRPFDGHNIWYITVAGYLAPTPLTYLERGVIYSIEDLTFPLSALTDQPEENVITVAITATTTIDWVRYNDPVTPDL
jgi:hypothetical protein